MDEVWVYAGQARALRAGAAGMEYGDASAWLVLTADGFARWGLPPRGVPSDLAWERTAIPSRWGTAVADGATTTVECAGVVQYVLSVSDAGLTDGHGDVWSSVPPLAESAPLLGVWARSDWTEPDAPRLTLGSDGRFQTSGRFAGMCGSLMNVMDRAATPLPGPYGDDAVFDPGAGLWRAEGLALGLAFDDGRVMQYALVTGADPASIILGETSLARVG